MPAESRSVNKVIYLIITFFLGYLGFHKFYAGKILAGVLYFLFCWTGIPAILAFVDFFIALFQSSDSQGNIQL